MGDEVWRRGRPANNLDVVDDLNIVRGTDARIKFVKAIAPINPQTDRPPVLALQLPCEAPGDPDITVVIDDAAKNIRAHR
jgi:hypothetical protein